MKTGKTKVLLIAANGLGKTGVPNVFMSIVRLLNKQYTFDIIITKEDYFYKDEFLSYGGNIFLIKEKGYDSKIKRVFYRLFYKQIKIKKVLNTILENNNYSIMHSFKENESYLFFKVAKKYNINKRILHVNRMFIKQDGFVGLYSNYSRKQSILYSTHNVAVSKQAGDSYYCATKYTILYNTYDENTYKYEEAHPNSLTLLQVGTISPLKNQLFSIEVFNILRHRIDESKLLFIGSVSDMNYYQQCLNTIKKDNIDTSVIFYPYDANQIQILKEVSYAVLPSKSEGLSLAALEAQALGIHVFASNGIPKEVDCGNIAFLPLESKRWADAIEKDYTKNMGKRKRANLSPFSNKRFANSISLIYKC